MATADRISTTIYLNLRHLDITLASLIRAQNETTNIRSNNGLLGNPVRQNHPNFQNVESSLSLLISYLCISFALHFYGRVELE